MSVQSTLPTDRAVMFGADPFTFVAMKFPAPVCDDCNPDGYRDDDFSSEGDHDAEGHFLSMPEMRLHSWCAARPTVPDHSPGRLADRRQFLHLVFGA